MKIILHASLLTLIIANIIIISNNPIHTKCSDIENNIYEFNNFNIFSGGIGTINDPYYISNISELQKIKYNLNFHYKLVNDIDASETKYWNNNIGFFPIGNESMPFNGSINGNGFKIINLCINTTNSYTGLFGYIGKNSTVMNLTLKGDHTKIKGGFSTGALAGCNKGIIINCSSNGNISGGSCVGGLIGNQIGGIIKNSQSSCKVQGYFDYIGGICGRVDDGIIINCISKGNVTGRKYIGGLLGFSFHANIKNSYCVSFTDGEEYIGGFIGENHNSEIHNSYTISYNYGELEFIGGFVGYNAYKSTIKNCHSIGKVNGQFTPVGGFTGINYGTIINSYSKVNVSGLGSNYGGFAGKNYGFISYCFSTGNVSGNNEAGGFLGVLHDGKIENCYSNGNLIGDGFYMGGFVGRIDKGSIINCYSTGEVYGSTILGGFIGHNKGTIENCYSTGNTIGYLDTIGGFAGLNSKKILNSYSLGNSTGRSMIGGFTGKNTNKINYCYSIGMPKGMGYVGGLIGINNNDVVDCYWDNYTSNTTTSDGGIGRNSTLMKQSKTFLNWNFSSPWRLVEKKTYPYLISFKPIINTESEFLLDSILEDNFYINNFNAKIQPIPSFNKISNWSFESNGTDWLSINSTTGVLTGFPLNQNVGLCYVNISVNDINNSTGYLNFTITIFNTPPQIITNNILKINENDQYFNDYNSSDDGKGKSTWSLKTNASWLFIKKDTGVLSGNPDNQSGTFWVNISVNDGNGGINYSNFTLVVIDINDKPFIIIKPLKYIEEGTNYSIYFEAIDQETSSNNLSWFLKTNAEWLKLKNNYLFGIPNNSNVGTYWVNISVADGHGGIDYINYTLTVLNVNNPPEIVTFSLPDATEDKQYNLLLEGFDLDPTLDDITWSISGTNADFLSIDSETGNLSFLPENNDIGEYWVIIRASDSHGGSDEVNLTFSVINVNDNPVIETKYLPDATEDLDYWFILNGSDIDLTNDILTWSIVGTSAEFLDLDTETGNLSGTPENEDIGTWWINISVNDGHTGFDWVNLTIKVSNVNDVPHLNKTNVNLELDEDSGSVYLVLTDLFIDEDGDDLDFGFSAINNFTVTILDGVANITPKENFEGTETIKFTATDGEESISIDILIKVNAVNDPPFGLIIEYNQSYTEGMKQMASASADDPEGDTLSYIWSSSVTGEIGTGLEINLSLPAGLHTINVVASDPSNATVETSFEVTIQSVEEPEPGDDDDDEFQWWILIMIVFLIVVIIVVMILMRKSGKEEDKLYSTSEEITRFQSGYTNIGISETEHIPPVESYPMEVNEIKDQED